MVLVLLMMLIMLMMQLRGAAGIDVDYAAHATAAGHSAYDLVLLSRWTRACPTRSTIPTWNWSDR